MTNRNTISDETFAAVIDGLATDEEKRSVYDAIKGDDELLKAFHECMYMKVFEKELENDFEESLKGDPFISGSSAELSKSSAIFRELQLSIVHSGNDAKNDPGD